MSEKNTDTLFKRQKATSSKPEDVAAEYLDGDNLKNLLDFGEFLRDNKLTPRWQAKNKWTIKSKKERVCRIIFNGETGYSDLNSKEGKGIGIVGLTFISMKIKSLDNMINT